MMRLISMSSDHDNYRVLIYKSNKCEGGIIDEKFEGGWCMLYSYTFSMKIFLDDILNWRSLKWVFLEVVV